MVEAIIKHHELFGLGLLLIGQSALLLGMYKIGENRSRWGIWGLLGGIPTVSIGSYFIGCSFT